MIRLRQKSLLCLPTTAENDLTLNGFHDTLCFTCGLSPWQNERVWLTAISSMEALSSAFATTKVLSSNGTITRESRSQRNTSANRSITRGRSNRGRARLSENLTKSVPPLRCGAKLRCVICVRLFLFVLLDFCSSAMVLMWIQFSFGGVMASRFLIARSNACSSVMFYRLRCLEGIQKSDSDPPLSMPMTRAMYSSPEP
jgi:uncharacterized membrane protein